MENSITNEIKAIKSADVVIIGAGVIGLFTAWFLGKSGKQVLVIDRKEPMREASGVNAGTMGMQNKRLPLIPYSIESVNIWKSLQTEVGNEIGYVECGGVRVAANSDEYEILKTSAAKQEKAGLDIDWLEGVSLKEKVPWLSDTVTAATYCPSDGYSNPLTAGRPLIDVVIAAGGKIVSNLAVKEIIANKPGVKLVFDGSSLNCEKVVIAAGAWSAELARLFGFHLDIALDVNMLSVTEPYHKIMDLIVTHVKGILTLKQLHHGSCIIGGGWQGSGSLETGRKDLAYASLLHNIRLACKIVPGLKRVNLLRCWSGFEGVTPDSLPYLGKLPHGKNVYIAACARGGWTLGPILGKLMAEVVTGHTPSMSIDLFDPCRFLETKK